MTQCEVWVKGEKGNDYQSTIGEYVDIKVGNAPIDAALSDPVRSNPTMPLNYDSWTTNLTGGLPYLFSTSTPPIVYLKGGCNSLPPPPPLDPSLPHDCLNGRCLPKTIYNTPGVFSNLAACQAGCAQNSTCTGECVSSAEIANLNQAVTNLRSRICP